MFLRLTTLLAGIFLLAACETAPNATGDAAGTSASGSTTASSSGSDAAGSGSGEMTINEELISIGDRVLFDFDPPRIQRLIVPCAACFESPGTIKQTLPCVFCFHFGF